MKLNNCTEKKLFDIKLNYFNINKIKMHWIKNQINIIK